MGGPQLIVFGDPPHFQRRTLGDKLQELSERSPIDVVDIERLIDWKLQQLDKDPRPSPPATKPRRIPSRLKSLG